MNLYKEGDKTHYNQPLEYCTLQRCWDKCLKAADYFNRKKKVEEFNRYGHIVHNNDLYTYLIKRKHACYYYHAREFDQIYLSNIPQRSRLNTFRYEELLLNPKAKALFMFSLHLSFWSNACISILIHLFIFHSFVYSSQRSYIDKGYLNVFKVKYFKQK
jgi:hypothetical protein